MRVSAEIADEFVRHLNALEDAEPGRYLDFGDVVDIIKELNSAPIDPVLIAEMLVELERRDWIESHIKGHIPSENSVRVTAKGQNRAAASVNYADHYRKAVDSLDLAPDDNMDSESLSHPEGSQFGAGPFGTGPFGTSLVHDAHQSVTSTSPLVTSSIDSTRWTGAQFVLVDRKVLESVRQGAQELHSVIHAMNFQSNSESQDLKALADALLAICSMAEPEVTILDRILASPKLKTYAKLIAIVATIRGAIGI